MKALKNFFAIVDFQTVLVTLLGVASTYLCCRLNLAADMPTGLIGVAIVFPIVFSINAAYRRREEALRYYASLKAHAVSLYYAHRDWVPSDSGDKDSPAAARSRDLVDRLLITVRDYFLNGHEREAEERAKVFAVFSDFSKSHEMLRQSGVPANEISRANQYVRSMVIEFERMRNILLYRTPVTLRAYSHVFLNSFPILFGPYFAYVAQKAYPAVGYLVAVIYSLVLVSLDNIQENLENPFDAVGVDDLQLDVAGEYTPLMED